MRKTPGNIAWRLCRGLREQIEYFGDESSLHGVGNVCSRSYIGIVKRLVFLCVMLASAFGMCWILLGSLRLYGGALVSFSVETDYLEWNTHFPTITICEMLDNEKLDIYLEDNHLPLTMTNFYREVNFLNRLYCKTCAKCVPGKNCAVDVHAVVGHYRSNCTTVLTHCWWNGVKFPCCDRFKKVETEFGTCYTFNSRLALNESDLTVLNRRTGPAQLDFTAMESVFGKMTLSPEIKLHLLGVGSQLRIHSADETIIFGGENILGAHANLPFVTDFSVHLKLEETVSAPSVLALPASARDCLFGWERTAGSRADVWKPHRYSYSACMLQCKAAAQLSRCNCTHHLMPRAEGVRICDLYGLICLSEAKDDSAADCECPPACEETLYQVVFTQYKQHNNKLTNELLERGTRGSVRLGQLPTLRVRRHVIRDMLGLTVDIGGVGGVFFGASILSFIEIIYLFCIRTDK